jgi:tetratricopeptide (TPR) repeat protein
MLSKFGISARGLYRPIGAVVLVASLIGGTAACSGKSDAELASDALSAGLTAQQAGDLDTARTQYKLCLKYDPNNKVCLYDIGLLSQTAGSLAEAENYYRMALASDTNYTPAIFNLALVRDKLGAPQEAISLYRHYVQLVPNDPGGHLNLGYLLIRSGSATEGYAELATAKRLNPALVVPTAPPSSSPSATPKPSASPTASPTPTA